MKTKRDLTFSHTSYGEDVYVNELKLKKENGLEGLFKKGNTIVSCSGYHHNHLILKFEFIDMLWVVYLLYNTCLTCPSLL